MNALSVLKRKKKGLKKALLTGTAVAGALIVGTASTASAALDLTAVTTAIAAAITDITAAGLILVGAYAAVWAVRQIKDMFAHG